MSRRKRVPKRNSRNRQALPVLISGILILILLFEGLPYFQHISAYRSAVDRYDFTALSQELAWIEENGVWLKRIPFIEKGELWLRLNQGEYEEMELELVQYGDDGHRFWLFQLYLLRDRPDEAEKVIAALQNPALQKLAQGMLWANGEDNEKAVSTLLTISDRDLNSEDQVLKNIALSRSYLTLGKLEQAQKSWQIAAEISSTHPLVLGTEYDLALFTGQWGRAKELSSQSAPVHAASYGEQVLVKKALLALVIGDRESYDNTLKALETKDKGEAYVLYLAGIKMYERGEFAQAAENLNGAIQMGLPDLIEKDAAQALTQAQERVEAEGALQAITGKR
ncbi:MAG TPA: hypothetical protein GX523_05170 [Desulfitobacterium dehalogenans]|uniref:Tetratricopeptide repeat protein n=1 Tax=Desulfitobacterium dehalogenans TaxID=36854 RepID=A0A7C7D8D0_9FIRM|nr:hypothetical protein [Desulfitobacterium dehalogenans]